MNVTWEEIKNAIGGSENVARNLLRKYKSRWKDEKELRLIDNQRIPTWYFILQYSKEFGFSEEELCKLFNYDIKLLKVMKANQRKENE